MSEFSNLIKFRNELIGDIAKLQAISFSDSQIEILNSLVKRNPDVFYNTLIEEYAKKYQRLADQNNEIINELKQEVEILTNNIDTFADDLFNTKGQKELFSVARLGQTIDKSLQEIILTRIGEYCDFRYPGLIMYPREKAWLRSVVVACDPLYILYDSVIDIQELIIDFSEVYRSRLRLYPDSSTLPTNQFGFLLFWDYLTYISFDQHSSYFNKIFNLLRPGGTALINYNNCDIYGSARLAEMQDAAYANGRMITDLAIDAGFEIIRLEDLNNDDPIKTHVSWIEVRKPGNLETVKAHQVLGEIKRK